MRATSCTLIKDFSKYPFITRDAEIFDGIDFPVPNACASCIKRACTAGYSSKELVVNECFKGLSYCHVVDRHGEDIVIVGFLHNKAKTPHDMVFKEDGLYRLHDHDIEAFKFSYSKDGAVSKRVTAYEKRRESRALHDLKYLVQALDRRVARGDVKAATEVHNEQNFIVLMDTINAAYNLLGTIKNHIKLNDFVIAPEVAKFEEEVELNLYGLLKNNVFIYNDLAELDDLRIDFTRDGPDFINAKRTVLQNFVLIPAILLQNAIKYSKGKTINVSAVDVKGKFSFSVSSFGTLIPQEFEQEIWIEGRRYQHDSDTKKGGSGFGLYLAQLICNLNGFKISYRKEFVEMDGSIPLGNNIFTVNEL